MKRLAWYMCLFLLLGSCLTVAGSTVCVAKDSVKAEEPVVSQVGPDRVPTVVEIEQAMVVIERQMVKLKTQYLQLQGMLEYAVTLEAISAKKQKPEKKEKKEKKKRSR